MFVEDLNAEADALLRSEGIEVAADRIDLTSNVLRGTVLGPFEDHVLDEMRDSVPLLVFIA